MVLYCTYGCEKIKELRQRYVGAVDSDSGGGGGTVAATEPAVVAVVAAAPAT